MADTPVLEAGARKGVQVQVLLSALHSTPIALALTRCE